jgi:hypothetical protein
MQFVTVSRRVRHWADVQKTDRPALFMTCHQEVPTYRNENKTAYQKLFVKLFVYIDSSDKSSVPDTDLSVILDAIDSVISPPVYSPTLSLGGLVSHCRVDGQIMRDPGDLDGDGILIVPVAITLT